MTEPDHRFPEPRTVVPVWAACAGAALGTCAVALAILTVVGFVVSVGLLLGAAWNGRLIAISFTAGVVTTVCGVTAVVASMTGARLVSPWWWRRRFLLSQRCPWCMYCTRHLPEPRCPECGEPWGAEDLRLQI